jgi:hypothetical protein
MSFSFDPTEFTPEESVDHFFYNGRAPNSWEMRFSEQEQSFELWNATIVLPSRFWKHGGEMFHRRGQDIPRHRLKRINSRKWTRGVNLASAGIISHNP